MKKKIRALMVVLLSLMCGCILSGCGGKPTVNLNDYVTITVEGSDGYGEIFASFAYGKLISDYEEYLSEEGVSNQYLGVISSDVAAEMIFQANDPFTLVYEKSSSLKNGDKVSFSWNVNESAVETLGQVLEVKFKSDKFEYTVEGLKEVVEIDPFENVVLYTGGIDGKGYLMDGNDWNFVEINLSDGEVLRLGLEVEEIKQYMCNGDVVHVMIDDSYTDEELAQQYGIILTSRETDVVVNTFAEYPSYDNPEEVFDRLNENIGEAIADTILDQYIYDYGRQRGLSAEWVGTVFYYQNEGQEFEESVQRPSHNQIMFVCHINDGIVPGGWYTYLSPNTDILLGYAFGTIDDEVSREKQTLYKSFDSVYPFSEKTKIAGYIEDGYGCKDYPIKFTYEGKEYFGHATVEECIEAFETNILASKNRVYQNKILSAELQALMSE